MRPCVQAQKRLIADRIQALNAVSGSSLPAVTPHQAAVLSKKMVLVKRYSATEAMQIHAAAAAAEIEQEGLAGVGPPSFSPLMSQTLLDIRCFRHVQ